MTERRKREEESTEGQKERESEQVAEEPIWDGTQ
jgi:hypothetical protein